MLGNIPEAIARRSMLYDKMFPQETVTANVALTANSHDTVWVDSSSGPISIDMPEPAVLKEFTIKKISGDGNIVTIIGNIDGQENIELQDMNAAISVKSIGTAWMITGSHKFTGF